MEESNTLRLELKEWEKAFAAANEGRKAGRNDIKIHPEIGPPGSSSPSATSEKRPLGASQNPSSKPPQKRQKTSHPVQSCLVGLYNAPRLTHKSPIHRTSLGPTPQKDGLVLGLFDLLSPASTATQTPSKKLRNSHGPITANSVATPSKHSLNGQDGEAARGSITRNHFKSPSSISKPSHPSSFFTPSTRRVSSTPSKRTPGSQGRISKLCFEETPAFLRRESQSWRISNGTNLAKEDVDYDNEAISWSPVKVRLPSKPAGKGLSALVRGLREMEDERLDEEMALMREMEMDGIGSRAPKPKDSEVFVVDSQVPDMPLGADGENMSGSDEEEDMEKEGRGRDGKLLKVWKKKGQRRTTRRVLIKPSKEKWMPEPAWNGGKDRDEEDGIQDGPNEVVTIAETQNLNVNSVGNMADDALETDHYVDAAESESGSDFGGDSTNTKKKKRGGANARNVGPKGKEKSKGISQQDEEKKAKGRPPAKKKKTISATAHANFRALKIKNKNSKGKGGARFGRRR